MGWKAFRMIMLGAARTVSWFAAEPARIRVLVLIVLLAGGLGAGIGYGTGYLLASLGTMLTGMIDL